MAQNQTSIKSNDVKNCKEGSKNLFEEIKIPVPHGYISGKWWGPTSEQPIIALHGWQDNSGTWDNLIPLLPSEIAILAIDFPGHGLSSHYSPGQFYYLFWDGVLLLRRIVKHYNWKKITILGHSLGGAIGFLYSGIFPDDVDKLIQIDIVSPTVRETSMIAELAGQSIDRFLKYETLTEDSMPCYSHKEMLDLVEDAYKGSVTRESCEILMKRGMAPSPNGKGYHFARDVRLKVAGLGFLSLDMILQFAGRIKCNVLNIKGNPGMSFDKPEYYSIILDKIRESAHVEFHEVNGTHHLHLNTPERINDIISKFIQQPLIVNGNQSEEPHPV